MRRARKYRINQPQEPLVLFPLIDLTGSTPVPLVEWETAATRWAEEGATWLHLVIGQHAHDPVQAEATTLIHTLEARGVAVQLAGVRTLGATEHTLAAGASRVVLDAPAEALQEAVARFGPERIVALLAASAGDSNVIESALALKAAGVERVLYRDVSGSSQARLARLGELAQKSGLSVIADCGTRTLDDLRQVRWVQPFGVEGVLVGQALDEGHFTLAEAHAALQERLPDDASTR